MLKRTNVLFKYYLYEKKLKEQEKLLAEKKRREILYHISMKRFLNNAKKTLLNNK